MKKLKPGFYIYILKCGDDSFYIGYTENLVTRLKYHYKGEGAIYTQKRQPVGLVFCLEFPTRDDALAAEKQIKKWKRSKKIALIEGDLELLRALSKNADLKPICLEEYLSKHGLENNLY